MPRLLLLFLLLTTLPHYVTAQTNRSALLQEYQRLDSIGNPHGSGNLHNLVDISKQMLDIARQLQVDTLILKANLLQGQSLQFLGIFDAALKIFYENLAIAQRINDCWYQSRSLFSIGVIYQSMNDPAKSQTFIQQAKQCAIACQDYRDTIAMNYEIGFNMAMMEQEDAGIRLVEQNLADARKTNNLELIINGIDNLSNLMAGVDEDKKALAYQLELISLQGESKNNLLNAGIYEHLSEIYAKLKDWDNAQKYQQLALKYANLIHSNDWIYECYKLQSMIDEARGQYKSALINHQRYLELKDSVYQSQYDEKMSIMSSLYELDSKQKAIALLEKDTKIKEGQIEEQRVYLLVVLLLLIILVLTNRFLNQRKTNKMRETFAQDLLKAQEQERQMISRELHDSVGQNILFIKNRLQRLFPAPDAPLVKSVDDALEEVRNIAKGLYPNQLEQYGLMSAVDTLCELVRESSGIFVSCDLQGIDEKLNREAKINCYRIIQECINNTLKHAEATAIRITSNLQPGKVELVVQDNGKGFDKSVLERKALRSFGLINMAERIKMLRGKFELETSANKGAKLTFVFPV